MSRLEILKNITSLSELAYLLNYRPKTLSYLLYVIPDQEKYKTFFIPKHNGDPRTIKAPTEKLKKLQKNLADLLNECYDATFKSKKPLKSLSHGFRNNHSIITNARKHRNRRYVFNIDLKNFFPSINFGRVRGYFIKNNHFNLDKNIATRIAQIACHDNELPQGSPCSPIISNLIAHLLDIRMANLAKRAKCTYSRYADDLTFSTNKKDFPEKIAISNKNNDWIIGKCLRKEIEKMDFAINDKKTSMQYRTSRQMTTGLIVNKKINIRREYYRKARSMCYELFKSNEFYLGIENLSSDISPDEPNSNKKIIGTINQLDGILSFIYQVKKPHYIMSDNNKNDKPTAITELYRKFLFYKHFFAVEKPLIICEGKTDAIYLKCALKQLVDHYGEFVQKTDDGFDFKIGFLNKMSKNLGEVLHMAPGSPGLLYLMNMFEKKMKTFKGQGNKHPIIILVDNDDGANKIKSRIRNKLKIKAIVKSYYKFAENLYILFVPKEKNKAIEDLFDTEILKTKIGEKVFNRTKNINIEKEYGKIVFAEKVIKAKQNEINFEGFKTVFDDIKKIIFDYSKINN